MIVVIDEEFYSPDDQKIMIMLGHEDKKNIQNMGDQNYSFANFPKGTDIEKVGQWMHRKQKEYLEMVLKKKKP